MRPNIRQFLADEDGITSVEYALLLSLIVVVAFTTWQGFGHTLVASLNHSIKAIIK